MLQPGLDKNFSLKIRFDRLETSKIGVEFPIHKSAGTSPCQSTQTIQNCNHKVESVVKGITKEEDTKMEKMLTGTKKFFFNLKKGE